MTNKYDIAKSWFLRYTGAKIDQVGDYILLTNFDHHMTSFVEQFDCELMGEGHPMQTATNADGLSMINFGMGSPNAATIMDLLVAREPNGVLFLGKCGGLKHSTEIGHFILPIGAIRGEGTGDDYFPPEVPALPSFKLHKFVSEKILQYGIEYRTGVVYTTNRRLWEWDEDFKAHLRSVNALAIDMETATLFIVAHKNHIAHGALLLVSDLPMTPDGIKTEELDRRVTEEFAELHLKIGIESMTEIDEKGEQIKHFTY